jgi:hypothetical protein
MIGSGWKALVIGLVLASAAPLRAEDQVHIYRPQGRTAEELAPLVRGVLGPGGTAVPDPGSGALLLRGEPSAVRQALEVLGQLDAPLRSFRVSTELVSREQARVLGFGISGWTQVGPLRVSRALEAPGARAVVRLDTRGVEGSGRRRSELVVVEGREGRIATGHLFPVSIYQDRPPRRGGTDLLVSPALLPVESGLRVRVRSAGEGLLDVEVEPFAAELGEPSFSMATRLRMRPGETLALGGLSRSTVRSASGTLRRADEDRADDTVVLLQVAALD